MFSRGPGVPFTVRQGHGEMNGGGVFIKHGLARETLPAFEADTGGMGFLDMALERPFVVKTVPAIHAKPLRGVSFLGM